eukprot:3905485-Pyramimonas_sp.AAC.2
MRRSTTRRMRREAYYRVSHTCAHYYKQLGNVDGSHGLALNLPLGACRVLGSRPTVWKRATQPAVSLPRADLPRGE